MIRPPKAGLLPLYLELYDEALPALRGQFQPFLETVRTRLEAEGVEIAPAPVCRTEGEIEAALDGFRREGCGLAATLHLAYSLSLEAAGPLERAGLPVLMIDATMDAAFGMETHPDRLMFNHGIHGVQDLASVLRRRGVPYRIVAGHFDDAGFAARAADCARGAAAARRFSGMRVLRVGQSFPGMGDFSVEEGWLGGRFGIEVETIAPADLREDAAAVTDEEIEAERRLDLERYEADLDPETHRRSLRVGLGLRRRLERGGYGAFSVNFRDFDSNLPPVNAVPFLEISKAMARGLGYAGEGDALTAALCGALAGPLAPVTFSEAFCPDWAGGALFISHMGEINPAVCGKRPLLCERDFPWTPALNPAVLAGAPAAGPAVWVNLAPGPDGRAALISAPAEVLEDRTGSEWRTAVRGWIRPAMPLPRFLEAYSRHGGTHHNVLVMGRRLEALEAFAEFAGLERVTIGP